jgi:hypothetical protein
MIAYGPAVSIKANGSFTPFSLSDPTITHGTQPSTRHLIVSLHAPSYWPCEGGYVLDKIRYPGQTSAETARPRAS